MNKKIDQRYLVIVWGDIEPSMHGPFKNDQERDAYAGKHRWKEGDESGIFMLDTFADGSIPEISSYSGGYMEQLVAEFEKGGGI